MVCRIEVQDRITGVEGGGHGRSVVEAAELSGQFLVVDIGRLATSW